MKAPEKIYLERILCSDEVYEDTWKSQKTISDDIEYIHKDAVIEKACEYLMECEFNDSPTIADRRKRVDCFKKYMEDKI